MKCKLIKHWSVMKPRVLIFTLLYIWMLFTESLKYRHTVLCIPLWAPLIPRTATVNQGKPQVIVTIGMTSRGRHSKGPPSVRGLTQHSWRGAREKLMTFTKKHVKKYVKNWDNADFSLFYFWCRIWSAHKQMVRHRYHSTTVQTCDSVLSEES